MLKSLKAVAVIMPVHNGADFLSEALESLSAQTWRNWRLYVLENASADDSGKILRRFQRQFPQKVSIRAVRFPVPPGIARNLLVGIASEELLAFWDQDDVHLPDAIEKLAGEIKSGVVAAFGNTEFIDESGRSIQVSRAEKENRLRSELLHLKAGEVTRRLAAQKGSALVRLGASMVDKGAFESVGGFWNYRGGEDFTFWVRLSALGSISSTERTVLKRRIHRTNLSSNGSRSVGVILAMAELERLRTLPPVGKGRWFRAVGKVLTVLATVTLRSLAHSLDTKK